MHEYFVKSSGVICERHPHAFSSRRWLGVSAFPVYEFARDFRFRQSVPPLISQGFRPASITFYGIAATGSYDDLNSLRDAPPGGDAPLTFPTGEGAARTGRRMRSSTQNRCGEPPGEFVQALGSPGRGAGPAIAGSEGSGFSLEKPPPEAECRPGYSKSPVFAPPAQGLAKGQAGTPQSAALPAPLPGEPLSVRIRPGLLIPLLCTAPHQSGLRPASFPGGEAFSFTTLKTMRGTVQPSESPPRPGTGCSPRR